MSLDAFGHPQGALLPPSGGLVARLEQASEVASSVDRWALPEDPEAGPASTLPSPDTTFVGREPEIVRLAAMVEAPGLVTVTGEGGVGKTRVVIEVARRQSRPVVFVPLADLDRTGATLAIRRASTPMLLSRFDAAAGTLVQGTTVQGATQPRPPGPPTEPRLLVLDSVEQVGQISELIAEIRAAVPSLTILVTSRSRLGLSNERVVHLTGLSVAPGGPAVELFRCRASAVGAIPPSVLDSQAAAIAALCRALDGVPLAIELAAARTRLMSPVALLGQIHSPNRQRMLTLLAHGPSDLPKRQLSMRATLRWSHRLLEPAHQVLFRRLGAFPGSFSLEAAEAIAGDTDCDDAGLPSEDVLDGIAEMVDLHLIGPMDASASSEPERIRFVMSDVARAFAAELLAVSDDAGIVARRLRRWCLNLLAEADLGIASVDEQRWLDRIDQEMPIIRHTLAGCAADGDGLVGLELVGRLGRYWCLRGPVAEAIQWCRTFVAATEDGPPASVDAARFDRARVAALGWWGRLAVDSGDLSKIDLVRAAHPAVLDPSRRFEWLSWTDNLVLALIAMGEFTECRALITDALRVAETHRDSYWTCIFLLRRALWRWMAVHRGVDRLALLSAEMAHVAAVDSGLHRIAARATTLTALNLMARRDWHGAHRALMQTLATMRLACDPVGAATALNGLGVIMIELDRPREAAGYLVEAITEAKRAGDRLGEMCAAWGVSFLACRLGRFADVAVAHDAVAENLDLLARALPAVLVEDYLRALATGAPADPADPTDAAGGTVAGPSSDGPGWGWLRGWAMGVATQIATQDAERAGTDTSGDTDGPEPGADPAPDDADRDEQAAHAIAPTHPGRTQNLTARELEILAAIASGRTNAQIAADFFLSTKTVMHHSVSIYRKLEVGGRAEAVALAYRTGLLQPTVG